MAARQYKSPMFDPELLAAVAQARKEYRTKKKKRSGAYCRVAKLRPDNPFLFPTPPERLPWRKTMPRRARASERRTSLIAALVWAAMMGFVSVAYALHAPLGDFPMP